MDEEILKKVEDPFLLRETKKLVLEFLYSSNLQNQQEDCLKLKVKKEKVQG